MARCTPTRSEFRVSSLVCTLALAIPAQAVEPAAPPEHTVVGRVAEHEAVGSEPIGTRRLWILLPPGYDAASRYPVLYVQDGQDLFDAATAAGREEWALDELLAAQPAGIPPVIVVGIEAAPQALRDYSPPGSTDGARGDAYVRFVAEVVKPLVDAAYSTQGGPEGAFVVGSGAGGVIALYAAWTRSDTFAGAIALELPDLDRASLRWTETPPGAGRPRLWIEQTGGDAAVRPSGTEMLDALRTGATVDYVIGSGTTSRVALFAAGLRALFTR